MIIGLAGKMHAGKDTAADVLVERHGFIKTSYGDTLKSVCSEAFDIPLGVFYHTIAKDSSFIETIIGSSTHVIRLREALLSRGIELNKEQYSDVHEAIKDKLFKQPRDILQYIGTDVCRKLINTDIWIDLTMKRIKELQKEHSRIVVPDCRFPDEREAIKLLGGQTGLIVRPNEEKDDDDGKNIHVSENLLGTDDEYDLIFTNDTTVGSFIGDIDMWFTLKC